MTQTTSLVVATALLALSTPTVAVSPGEILVEEDDSGLVANGGRRTRRRPIHLTGMAEGVDAWPDLPGSKLSSPPKFMELMPTVFSNWQLPGGSCVRFHCPNEPDLIDVCDVWVFYYRCPQSCSTEYQGGLPGLLDLAHGWERTQCGPRFETGVSGTSFKHPTAGFRMQLEPGMSTSITLPATSEFISFGIDANGIDCTLFNTADTCPVLGGRCRWENDECINQTCKGRFGPAPPCLECPWEGLVSRPASDGPH